MFLILGSHGDPHVAAIQVEFDRASFPYTVLDHDRPTSFSLDLNGPSLTIDGRCFDLETISGAWVQSKIIYPQFGSGEGFRNANVQGSAWKAAISNIAMLLGNRAVNSWRSIDAAKGKLDQLVTARGFGMNIPPTLLSNETQMLLSWRNDNPNSITKALGSPLIPDESSPTGAVSFMTTAINWDVVERNQGAVSIAPTLVQREIPKSYELRVAILGADAHIFRINSQALAYARTDWRYASPIIDYTPADMPSELVASCFSFLGHFGLFSGSFDFIVDDDGQYWFLECNSQGYWAFLNDASGGAIGRMFATQLMDRSRLVRAN